MASTILPSEMYFRIGDGTQVRIVDEDQLTTALTDLENLEDGKLAVLSKGSKHYVEAVKRGDLWSASARSGGFWTKVQFFPGETVVSERYVRASRAANPRDFWRLYFFPPDLTGLNQHQVESLFVAFWNDADWPVPILSDGA